MPDSLPIDSITRSNRRTISITVQPDGSLVVRAPLRMNERSIYEFVERHADWIHRKQDQIRAAPPLIKKAYQEGELFLYLGKEYPLRILTQASSPLSLQPDGFQIVRAQLPRAQQSFIHWYKKRAKELIPKRVTWLARQNGLTWQGIRISSARTRWGSCSSRGSLSFTWRLVLAPLDVIDYVVVHELVHTTIRNHSPSFWRRLGEILPDYRQQTTWLKANGRYLTLDEH